MAGTQPGTGSRPGDRSPAPGETPGETPGGARPVQAAERRLDRAPSERYGGGDPGPAGGGAPSVADGGTSALGGPLIRALVVAVIGAGALFVVGALLASTAGLLFTAGATGGGIGLVLARAAAPRGEGRPVARRNVAWIAVGLAIGAVAVASVATWVVARGEGGTLGLVDYLLETFGAFVPGEAIVAGLAAVWGANTGPVQA